MADKVLISTGRQIDGNRKWISARIGLVLLFLFVFYGVAHSEDAFILLTEQGTLQFWFPEDARQINLDLSRHLDLREPVQFVAVAGGKDGIFVLNRNGRVYSVLDRRIIYEIPQGGREGVDLLMDGTGRRLWVLDSQGGIHAFDFQGMPIPGASYRLPLLGEPQAASRDKNGRLWVINREGILFAQEESPILPIAQPFLGKVVDFRLNPQRLGGVVLDSSGELYLWGDALGKEIPPRPEFGRQLAVAIQFSPTHADTYYLLDSHGSVFHSRTKTIQMIADPSSDAYQALDVMDSAQLLQLWKRHYPPLSVWVEPPEMLVPYWRASTKFQLQCEEALDLTEFYCLMEFNPEVLRTRQIFQGELFQPAGRRGIILDESRGDEGILEIRGVSLDKRSGGGMSGSGSLFEVEMDIFQPGSSGLRILEFQANSPSLPGQPIELAGISHGRVNVFSAQPSIYLNFQTLSISLPRDEDILPQTRRRITVGERFNVYLQVNHVKSLKGLRYDLSFDADMLEYISLEEGVFLNQQGATLFLTDPVQWSGKTGILKDQGIAILGRGPGVSGPGEVVRYLFRGHSPGTARIRINEAVLVDENRERKPFQVSSAQVEVEIVEKQESSLR